MLKIRPHHLICMQLYVGKGYSDEFNESMKNVVLQLESGSEFELTGSDDSICSKCPNLRNGACIYNDKVIRYDMGMLEYLQLDFAKRYLYDEIKDLSKVYGALESLCSDCEWNKTCRKILNNKVKCNQ